MKSLNTTFSEQQTNHMKRQTRPFVVEIKQSRHGLGKAAPKPLWSGRDLLLLKEAQPEPTNEQIAEAARERVPAVTAPPARILAAASVPLSADALVAAPGPTKQRKPRVRKPPVEPVHAPIAPVAPDPMPSAPILLRDRSAKTLPRGQRWKRRLPKVIW
jgi:hypothetical protein